MRAQLNLDTAKFTVKPTSKDAGHIQKRIGSCKQDIDLRDFVIALSNGQSFKSAALNGSKNTDWESQQIFTLDFDNGFSMDAALERCKQYNIMPIIKYYTFSSGKDLEKFRLIFCLKEKVIDSRVAKMIQLALMNIFKECDKACKDLSRMFYATNKIIDGNVTKQSLEGDFKEYEVYDSKEPLLKVYDIVQAYTLYVKTTDSKNFSRVISSFCRKTGVNKLKGRVDARIKELTEEINDNKKMTNMWQTPYIYKENVMNSSKLKEAVLKQIANSLKTPDTLLLASNANELLSKVVTKETFIKKSFISMKKLFYNIPEVALVDNNKTLITFNTSIISKIFPSLNKDTDNKKTSKTTKQKDIRTFDFNELEGSCKLYNDFITSNRHISHSEYFGLVTNIIKIRGAEKRIIEILEHDETYSESYNNKVDTLNSIKDYGYYAQRCSGFCPYNENNECKCYNILQSVKLKRGQTRLLHDQPTPLTLEQVEEIGDSTIINALFNNNKNITVYKGACASGKSRLIADIQKQLKRTAYCFPTHLVAEQMYDDLKVNQRNIVYLRKLKLNDETTLKKFNDYQSKGLFGLARNLIKSLETKLEAYSKGRTLLEEEKQDLESIKDYFNSREKAETTEDLILMSHEKALSLKNPNIDTYIFDEDVLQSSIVKTVPIPPIESAKKTSIIDLIDCANKLDLLQAEGVLNLLKDTVQKALKAPYTVFDLDISHFFNVEKEIVSIAKYKSDIDINLLALLQTQSIISDGDVVLGVIKRELPNKKCIILSATANEWIYKVLFPNRKIDFVDASFVETKGRIILHDKSYSRQYLQKTFDKALEQIKRESPGIKNMITFSTFEDNFKKAGFNVITHFGNCTALNSYQGQDLLVVGTPRVNKLVYLLYAHLIDPKMQVMSTIDYKPVKRNGFEFYFNGINNDSDITPVSTMEMLQEIQFYLIESELIQAVGRARILRFDCTVHLYSGLPLPGVELYSE